MLRELATQNDGGGNGTAAHQETSFEEWGSHLRIDQVDNFIVHGSGVTREGQKLELGPLPNTSYSFVGSVALVNNIKVSGGSD